MWYVILYIRHITSYLSNPLYQNIVGMINCWIKLPEHTLALQNNCSVYVYVSFLFAEN